MKIQEKHFLLKFLNEFGLFHLCVLVICQFSLVVLMFFFEFSTKLNVLLDENSTFGFAGRQIGLEVDSLSTKRLFELKEKQSKSFLDAFFNELDLKARCNECWVHLFQLLSNLTKFRLDLVRRWEIDSLRLNWRSSLRCSSVDSTVDSENCVRFDCEMFSSVVHRFDRRVKKTLRVSRQIESKWTNLFTSVLGSLIKFFVRDIEEKNNSTIYHRTTYSKPLNNIFIVVHCSKCERTKNEN